MYDVSYLDKISSIDKNKIIRAVNAKQDNPFPEREECQRFYDSLIREKTEMEAKYGQPLIFSLVEPDEEEEEKLMALLPD